MSELAETTQFLAGREPWSRLPPAEVSAYARLAVASYVRRGTVILASGSPNTRMHVIRSGAVEIRDAEGVLVDHDEEGQCFGQSSIIEERPSRFTFTATEDTLLWSFEAEVVRDLVRHASIGQYFTESRIGDTTRQASEDGPVLRVSVAEMITRPPVTVQVDSTVGDAAIVMHQHRISAVVVTEEDKLVGILTDRDLRRVVAMAQPGTTPLREVMTGHPHTVSKDALALDVLLSLVEHRIHHLPVMSGGQVVGMVTSGDMMRLERSSPLYLVGDLGRQDDVAGLAAVMGRLPRLVSRLLRQDATAEDISRIISRTTEALWQRLAELGEQRFGPPPVPYCWIALGSLARQEQALGSDQDHAFILDDAATAEHDAYFSELAAFLTSALVQCGYSRCDGDIMATNPRWRQPLAQWWRTFSGWLSAPTSDAVLHSSIFLDMRAMHGDRSLADRLHQRVVAAAPQASRFLGHLASHAGDIEVPIGFWRGFVLEKQGAHRDRLDVKLGGINPIVDVARVYALKWGLPQVGTRARLAATAEHGGQVDNLLDAHEFLGYTRLQHQGRQVAAGEPPDNFIAPGELSEFERRTLRDAFTYVGRAQRGLAVSFQTQFM